MSAPRRRGERLEVAPGAFGLGARGPRTPGATLSARTGRP
ncbi:hypothetical protein HMPREF0682_1375 [Propionibacterium acidifaciens F0233]|uniref:Uncharacterized protein n=1 Tax=Propionibacterium acidifaciens F0233 TaxID=553198 RepID=U2QDV8_9ACTN|nr:hypothetical protein HMPREF0682_1375 [Propionibacterium acidifaciens F0233]